MKTKFWLGITLLFLSLGTLGLRSDRIEAAGLQQTVPHLYNVRYGLVQDSTDPLKVTAVLYPDFTSNNVSISTAVFTLLLPAEAEITPTIPMAPANGQLTNRTGVWTVQKITPGLYSSIGFNPTDLQGFSVYQAVLSPGTANPTLSANQTVPLFTFQVPADCTEGTVEVLTNNSAIQQKLMQTLGANMNNQMSVSLNDAPTLNLYAGNQSGFSQLTCPLAASPDTDGDGVADNVDLDDDNDGIPDALEGSIDSDGDGTPNSLDLDSDGDGIADVIEAGGSDPNGDGKIGDGTVTDSDGDGLADAVDPDNGGRPLTLFDGDNDGIPNVLESNIADSDSDGSVDQVDPNNANPCVPNRAAGMCDLDSDGKPNQSDSDADGDGFSNDQEITAGTDVYDPESVPGDNDGDGIPDVSDPDDDNDGLIDTVEAMLGTDPHRADSDGDGQSDSNEVGGDINAPKDSDGDDIIDALESGLTDADKDGTNDQADPLNHDPCVPNPLIGVCDFDGDGQPNSSDLDDDGDNIPDSVEGDRDTDGDGMPNRLDLDSDSDGKLDSAEGTDDADKDGVPNYVDSVDNSKPSNTLTIRAFLPSIRR